MLNRITRWAEIADCNSDCGNWSTLLYLIFKLKILN